MEDMPIHLLQTGYLLRAGKDVNGPTAAASSVAKLDHFIVSNGTLFNQKFHPSALSGTRRPGEICSTDPFLL